MSKKIIIVGPPGAGKTTLRKTFFEGENSKKLLEYALEPTFGEESLILRLPGLNEDIGIFDLAGQENERWLETEDKKIFLETKAIIVVIDITASYNDVVSFIKKIIELRNELTPDSMIYILLHKIDLVSEKKIREIKAGVKTILLKESSIKSFFTSLKPKFFNQTFSNFIEIMKKCLEDVLPEEGLMLNVIDESLKIINILNNEISISKQKLKEKINRPEKLTDYLIENLVTKEHVEIKTVKSKITVSLTEKGKNYYKDVIKTYTNGYLEDMNLSSKISEPFSIKKVPSFIGAFIADKDGRTLLKIEIYDDALKNFILSSIPSDDSIVPIDLDLIPMFVSALEKFSLELNIQDLSGFVLEGSNLKLHIFGFEDYTVTFFMNPDINLHPIENRINNYFKNLFEKYKKEFDSAVLTGQVDQFFPLIKESKEWLNNLNRIYEEMIINLEIFDTESAKHLYSKMDELYNRVNVNYSLTLEKIKKLKVNLMKAIIENDYQELKKIAHIIKELSSKYIE